MFTTSKAEDGEDLGKLRVRERMASAGPIHAGAHPSERLGMGLIGAMGPLSLAWCHLARHSVQQHSSLSASPLPEQGLEKWSLELLSCLICVLFKGRWEGLRDSGRLWAKRPF